MSEYVAEIAGKVAADPNYVLSKEDERVLQVSRKADPATMMIEDIQAEAIRSRLSQTVDQGSYKLIHLPQMQ